MTPHNPAELLADAASALVREHDVGDLLVRLVRDAASLAGSEAAGLLVRPSVDADLEVLAATNHVATHLEVYQTRQDEGPCVDVCTTGLPVMAAGAAALLARWPTVGAAMLNAGFRHVHAYPLVWNGRVLGGLNLFGHEDELPSAEGIRMAHAFADMLTLVVAQPERVPDSEIDRRLTHALEGRVDVERAKGVLAQGAGVDMAAAYDLLLARRDRDGASLTETAQRVVAEAYRA